MILQVGPSDRFSLLTFGPRYVSRQGGKSEELHEDQPHHFPHLASYDPKALYWLSIPTVSGPDPST